MVKEIKKSLYYWLEIIGIALLYFVTAKMGQTFAIPPGNITPVWLPSGIMLALVMIRGHHIWPGIFLGAFVGNVSSYINFTSIDYVIRAVISGAANGLGDVLACVWMVYLFKKTTVTRNIFGSFTSFWPFLLFCCLLGPLISALFGIISLELMGFLTWDSLIFSLITWWTGDSVGVLLLTPLILSFHRKNDSSYLADRLIELSFYLIIFTAICSFMGFQSSWPELLPNPIFFTIPLLLWSVLRLGFRVTLLSTFVLAAIAIIITNQQHGPFSNDSQLHSIIELQLYLTLVITSVLVVGIVLSQRNKLVEELQLKYDHDLLTGVYTRSCFIRLFDSEAHRFSRYGTQFCLIMFDIDHFKKINDTLGHAVGDEVLISVCHLINEELRGIDSLGRWGGEEFFILLPSTTLQDAFQIAERCRIKISQHDFHIHQQITISLGVLQSQNNIAMKDMMNKADEAMYLSKRNGRNQTTIAESY
ncbi:MAG: diguanylate cyclase [Methylococcaceae bacterium]|nr:diguanylate cyclase [Methylococcaceae bacterium]